jgi:4-hydroxy-tetrahydrodipicolinate synthase
MEECKMVGQAPDWQGVFVIVPTPFDTALELDIDSLRRTVRFCLACGVDGVVATGVASEAAFLSDAERRTVAEIVVDEARGKAATLIGASAGGAAVASALAAHAHAIGADGLMVMPPTAARATEGEILDFYRRVGGASPLPIMLQNFNGPGGTPMGARQLAALFAAVPTITHLKEETEFPGPVMSEVLGLVGDRVRGVMGGKAGIKMIDEWRRGACGTMPACEVADIHVAIWRALVAGDLARAKEVFRLLLPLLVFEGGYGAPIYKEVLFRRGVIATPAYRQTGARPLDRFAQVELADILADLGHLMHPSHRV